MSILSYVATFVLLLFALGLFLDVRSARQVRARRQRGAQVGMLTAALVVVLLAALLALGAGLADDGLIGRWEYAGLPGGNSGGLAGLLTVAGVGALAAIGLAFRLLATPAERRDAALTAIAFILLSGGFLVGSCYALFVLQR